MTKLFGFALLILFVGFSCSKNKKDTEKKFSLMELAEDADSFIAEESKSVFERFDAAEHRTYYGIDVSHYQGDLIELMKSTDSLHYVITKATEGTGFVDPDFGTNWRAIKNKGLIRGAYHFYLFKEDPVAQAKHFTKHISDIEDSDIAPIVDVEEGSLNNTSVSKEAMKNDLIKFLKEVESSVNRKPIIYTNTAFANQYLTDSVFSSYKLWLAEYTKGNPKVPEVWDNEGYLIWQKSQSYHTHSITTDFDVYQGKLHELVK